MLIAEHFFLIANHPQAGWPDWPHTKLDARTLTAAALLLELAVDERVSVEDDRLLIDIQVPLNHPLLTRALHLLNGESRETASAIRLLARHIGPGDVLEGLYRRDLLHRVESRRWLLMRRVRYPLRSVQSRNEALQRLRGAAHSHTDDLHGLGLILLADQSGLLAMHLDATDHERATRRLLALNSSLQPSEAHRVFAAVRDALLA